MQYPVSRIKLSKRVAFQSPGFHLPFGLVEWIGPIPEETQADSSLAWAGINIGGAMLCLLGAASEVLKDCKETANIVCWLHNVGTASPPSLLMKDSAAARPATED